MASWLETLLRTDSSPNTSILNNSMVFSTRVALSQRSHSTNRSRKNFKITRWPSPPQLTFLFTSNFFTQVKFCSTQTRLQYLEKSSNFKKSYRRRVSREHHRLLNFSKTRKCIRVKCLSWALVRLRRQRSIKKSKSEINVYSNSLLNQWRFWPLHRFYFNQTADNLWTQL